MTHLSVSSAPLTTPAGEATLLTFAGGVDGSNDAPLHDAMSKLIADESVMRIAIDGSQLEYIDSRFIGRLVELGNTLQARGGRLVLVNFHENALDTLETVGVTSLIPHTPNTEEAAAMLASAAE